MLEGEHLSGGCEWQDASGQNSGLNSMPKGHKTLRLYDADEYLDVEAGDLVGLPPLLIQCGGGETMLDDSLEFAAKAARARVQVRPRAPTTALPQPPAGAIPPAPADGSGF